METATVTATEAAAGVARVVHVVDRHGVGWIGSSLGHYLTPDPYARHQNRSLTTSHIDDLTHHRGPLRTVVTAPPEDLETLRLALLAAGQRAMATLAFALHQVTVRTGADLGAGWPDSHASRTLRQLARLGQAVHELRIHPQAAATTDRVIYSWVTGDTHFVEVAHHLSLALSRIADEQGGWTRMADMSFQTCGIAPELQRYATTQHARSEKREGQPRAGGPQ